MEQGMPMDTRTSKHGKVTRIRVDEFGLDEFVAEGCDVHIERLDDGKIWFNFCGGPSNKRWNFIGTFSTRQPSKVPILCHIQDGADAALSEPLP